MNRNNINMTMRKYILPALLVSAALPAVAHAATLQDVWATPGANRIHSANRVDAGIAAGSAPIEQALATLIPAPYRIEIDSRVPNNWIVVWPAGQDWLSVLRAAVEPMGLRVVPEWSRGEIKILMASPRTEQGASASAALTPATLTPPEPRETAHGPAMQPASSEAVSAKGWSMPAPAMPSRTVHLIDAIQLLMPPSLAPRLELEVLAANLNAPAHWAPGSRWGALQSMLHGMGLQARQDGKTLRIAPWPGPDPEAAAPQQTAAPQRPMVPAAAPAAVRSIPAFKPIPLWTLKANQAISVGLDAWAHASGWKVVWNVPQDWLVPNTVQFQGDFRAAATQVIQALAANGADIRADVYTANKTLVVHAAGQGG